MEKIKITVIIPARNESPLISDALNSVKWCDEVILVDNNSTDDTSKIAKRFKARIVTTAATDFNERKNIGLKIATNPWLLYIDADERVTPLLRQEIIATINGKNTKSAYLVPRKNIYLGKIMHFGGWGDESLVRLFKKSQLSGWKGMLHERPEVRGEIGKLIYEIIHLSHRDLDSMVEKTIIFTQKEAVLRFQSDHPKVTWWRFYRVMFTEAWFRLVKLKAFLDGTEGIIDGMFQVFNMFIIYARLWELQNGKNINRVRK